MKYYTVMDCLVGKHHKLSGLSKRLRVITLLRPDSLWCIPLISPVLLWQYQFCCHGTSKQMIRFEFVVYQYAVSKLSPLLNVQEGKSQLSPCTWRKHHELSFCTWRALSQWNLFFWRIILIINILISSDMLKGIEC